METYVLMVKKNFFISVARKNQLSHDMSFTSRVEDGYHPSHRSVASPQATTLRNCFAASSAEVASAKKSPLPFSPL